MKHLRIITILSVMVVMSLMMTACGSSSATAQNENEAGGTTEATTSSEEAPTVADSADIGAEKVKGIVLAKVPGAVEDSIYEFERDFEDGRIEYEGSLYHDGYEYEFEVDGATGNILKWEIDD